MSSASSTVERVQQLIASAFVVVFSKSWCPFCDRVKQIFETLGVPFRVIELDQERNGEVSFARLLSAIELLARFSYAECVV